VALTFRAYTSVSGASGNAVTVNKPTGTADGDILVAAFYWEGTNQTLTPPTGWTQVRTPQRNTGVSPNFMLDVYWKRASGEPASWDWTPSVNTQWRIAACVAYSGGSGTGDQIDVSSGHGGKTSDAGNTNSIRCLSVTTTVGSETVLAIHDNFNGNTTSWVNTTFAGTARVQQTGLEIWEGTQTSAGATGDARYTYGTEDFNAMMVALKTDSGGAATKAPPPFQRRTRFVDRRHMV
jgi:hypothetical protein